MNFAIWDLSLKGPGRDEDHWNSLTWLLHYSDVELGLRYLNFSVSELLIRQFGEAYIKGIIMMPYFVKELHRWPGDLPYKWPVLWNRFPCFYVIRIIIARLAPDHGGGGTGNDKMMVHHFFVCLFAVWCHIFHTKSLTSQTWNCLVAELYFVTSVNTYFAGQYDPAHFL